MIPRTSKSMPTLIENVDFLAARCNVLAHKFARYSNEVKITYSRKIMDPFRVQYNNGFKVLLGLPRYVSA